MRATDTIIHHLDDEVIIYNRAGGQTQVIDPVNVYWLLQFVFALHIGNQLFPDQFALKIDCRHNSCTKCDVNPFSICARRRAVISVSMAKIDAFIVRSFCSFLQNDIQFRFN